MLAGLRAGQVQLLKRDDRGKVTVSRNETDIVGWSADEILRNFLEVPSPTDLKTAQDIERLHELGHIEKPTASEAAELEHLRHAVNQALLGGPIASQIEQLRALLERARAAPSGAPQAKRPRKPEGTKPTGKASSTSTVRRTSR